MKLGQKGQIILVLRLILGLFGIVLFIPEIISAIKGESVNQDKLAVGAILIGIGIAVESAQK